MPTPTRRLRTALLVSLTVAPMPPLVAQGLTGTERRITAAVEAGVADATALLERTVNINSGSLNLEGVRAVGGIFRTEFNRLGFTTRWVDGAAWGRAGHLLAERRGHGRGPRILLIGHLDTVFEADSPFQRYTAISPERARGPGTTDMKGGNVVMLLALRALAETGQLDDLQIQVVLIGDEEDSGDPLELARKDLIAAAEWADIAMGFEDGDGNPATAVIGRRGSTSWILRTTGRPAHSSQIFREGYGSGAIFEAARILSAFHDSLSAEPNLTFNPGAIVGGTAVTFDPVENRGTAFGKTNVIAEQAVVAGDLRTLTPEQLASAKLRMTAIVAQHHAETGATIEFHDSYPPLAPTDGNRQLLARLGQVSQDQGGGPVAAVDPARAGAADISFTAGLVEMALDGVGLMGTGGHTVEETADLTTLPLQAGRGAVLLHRLARGQPGA